VRGEKREEREVCVGIMVRWRLIYVGRFLGQNPWRCMGRNLAQ
jgi:hypothetical protein